MEIVNLQLLQKLYFIRQELQILNQVTPSVEDKIRELMERVHYSMRDTSKIEQYF